MTDTPVAHLTEEEFLSQTSGFEPFRFTLSGKKGTIVFPDFNAASVEDARAVEAKINNAIDPLDAMQQWLSAEDYQKLVSANLNARKINALFSMAWTYTQGDKRARKSITASALDAECQDPKPYTFVLRNSKRIIFPDFASGSMEDVREFYRVAETNRNSPEVVLQHWIGKDSFENLKSLDLNARQLADLTTRAIQHYEATRGTPGESRAS